MLVTIIVSVAVCAAMILGVLFFPTIRLGKIKLDTYWIVTSIGAVIVWLCSSTDIAIIGKALTADTAINPLKILALFLSMTVLSIFLDEVGFFRKLASFALSHAKGGQTKMFVALYLLVSVLTVFTSNDVIILSFTPFICYFAKSAKIDPIPYLAAEFVAANTWSMALIIGNPTNIYLATAAGIGFLQYIQFSFLPTLFGGSIAFVALYVLFRKKLKTPLHCEPDKAEIQDKFLFWVGIVHLAVATILLAIGSYIGIAMWLVSVCAVGSLLVFILVTALVRKHKPVQLLHCLRRTPFPLVPFVLSMFVIIVILGDAGVTEKVADLLSNNVPILTYGTTSFLFANLINNIPMSVLYSSIIGHGAGLKAVLATIIGSNIGAYFTPIGALAGIMFGSIIEKQGIKFGYLDFLKIGVTVAIPSLFAALGGLWLTFAIF